AEEAIRGAGIGVRDEPRLRAGAPRVVRSPQDLDGVRVAGDDLRHGYLEVRREPPDEAPDGGPSKEERRIGDELEALAGLPADEAVGAVAHGSAAERRAPPLLPGHGAHQVTRQH